MQNKTKFAKGIAASLMAATMIAPSMTAFVPMSASAAKGEILGETSFEHKALPWHTCESSPAKQNFALEDGMFHVTILKAKGGDGDRWDLQFRHRNIDLQAGHTYTITWSAKANRAGVKVYGKISNIKGDEEYWVSNPDGGGQGPAMGGSWGNAKAVELTTSMQTFTSTFECSKDLEGVEWAFHYAVGGSITNSGENSKDGDEIWFDNMSIIDSSFSGDNSADDTKTYGATSRDKSTITNPDMKVNGKTANYISVNQIGYYTKLAKTATLGDNSGDVLYNASSISLTSDTYTFELVDASSGTVVYTGTTGKKFYDKDSDDNVCKIDFTEYDKPGRYYLRIKGQDWRSFEFNIGDNIYYDESHNMLTNALNYFYQNRSGCDIEAAYITSGDTKTLAHVGGHTTDTASVQKVWKNEYASADEATGTYASSKITANKGWYDAGDHGKYVVNGGISVWTLLNMYERAIQTEDGVKKFADGSKTMKIPESGNGTPDILDECDYELSFISDMVVKSDEPTWGKYAGMVYHKLHDHKWTGLATRPYDYFEEWGTVRIVKPPTFAATLNYAACAAQAARLWEPYDSSKAAAYLKAAKTSYQAYLDHYYPADKTKTTHPDLNCECEKEELNEKSLYAPMWHAKGGGPYGDNDVLDDAYWAACEIFVSASALGDSAAAEYKTELEKYENVYKVTTRITGGENKDGSLTSFNWGNTASAGSLTLALHKDLLDASAVKTLEDSIIEAADTYIKTEDAQGYGIPYLYDGPGYNDPNNLDPKIMIYGYEWGSNSMVINNCIVMAYAYDQTAELKYMDGVATGMNYLLGCNPLAFSFITGYGSYMEKNPHHRYWSYELDKTLPMAPDGVLSGGPNSGLQDPYVRALGFVPGKKNNPSQRCFVDSIEAWSTNEVTINWNAPLAWIVSFLQDEAPNPTPRPTTTGGGQTTTGGGSSLTAEVWGDANCDGKVSVADVVLIMQSQANPGTYKITEQGAVNADVDNNGNGITSADALMIQQYLLKQITSLDPTK